MKVSKVRGCMVQCGEECIRNKSVRYKVIRSKNVRNKEYFNLISRYVVLHNNYRENSLIQKHMPLLLTFELVWSRDSLCHSLSSSHELRSRPSAHKGNAWTAIPSHWLISNTAHTHTHALHRLRRLPTCHGDLRAILKTGSIIPGGRRSIQTVYPCKWGNWDVSQSCFSPPLVLLQQQLPEHRHHC